MYNQKASFKDLVSLSQREFSLSLSLLWKNIYPLEKLTHDFTQSPHDNHPLTVIWNQWCVSGGSSCEEDGNVLTCCWSGKCRHVFDGLTLRQVTQVYIVQVNIPSITACGCLVPSAALYCQPAAH